MGAGGPAVLFTLHITSLSPPPLMCCFSPNFISEFHQNSVQMFQASDGGKPAGKRYIRGKQTGTARRAGSDGGKPGTYDHSPISSFSDHAFIPMSVLFYIEKDSGSEIKKRKDEWDTWIFKYLDPLLSMHLILAITFQTFFFFPSSTCLFEVSQDPAHFSGLFSLCFSFKVRMESVGWPVCLLKR